MHSRASAHTRKDAVQLCVYVCIDGSACMFFLCACACLHFCVCDVSLAALRRCGVAVLRRALCARRNALICWMKRRMGPIIVRLVAVLTAHTHAHTHTHACTSHTHTDTLTHSLVGAPQLRRPRRIEAVSFPAAAAAGKLHELTVTELKDLCKANRLPVSGRKADLIARIIDELSGA